MWGEPGLTLLVAKMLALTRIRQTPAGLSMVFFGANNGKAVGAFAFFFLTTNFGTSEVLRFHVQNPGEAGDEDSRGYAGKGWKLHLISSYFRSPNEKPYKTPALFNKNHFFWIFCKCSSFSQFSFKQTPF